MAEIRLIVAGGRDFSDRNLLEQKLTSIAVSCATEYNNTDEVVIVSGHCRGADVMAEQFGEECGIRVITFPADWDKHGKSAGPIRNRTMAEYASEGDNIGVLIAFWDGKSKGTKSMIDLGLKHLHEVHVIKY